MEKHKLIIKSNRNEIKRFDALLEEVNKKFNLSVEKFLNLQIACSEALINAVVHGNKENENKNVHICIEINGIQMKVCIRDEGRGFKVEDIPDPTSNENILKESGRGIYIIKSLVDKFECHSSDKGTEYILTVKK